LSRFQLKKGVLIHPFSDNSGLCLYNVATTVITSLGISEELLSTLLSNQDHLNEDHRLILQELLDNGFAYEEQ